MKLRRSWFAALAAGLVLAGCSGSLDGTRPGAARARPVVAAYYAASGKPAAVQSINAARLSHLIYAFVIMCGDHVSIGKEEAARRSQQCRGRRSYELTFPDDPGHASELAAIAELKRSNPDLVVIASVGGWGMPLYPDMIRTAASRQAFIASAADLLRANPQFDGVDIDWEYPGGGDNVRKLLEPRERDQEAEAFRVLAKELRAELDRLGAALGRRYQLTAAIAGYPRSVAAVDWPATHPYFDYLFVMTYDFTPEKAFALRGDFSGGGGLPGHHTNLHATAATGGYGADAMIRNLLSAGIPARKMVMGTAFYGREWSGPRWEGGAFPASASAGSFVGSPSYVALKQRGLQAAGFTYGYDESAAAAYYAAPDGFISIDDRRSICAKGAWARAQGLAGLFSWELSHDDGTLLGAMRDAAYGACDGGEQRR